MPAAGLIILLYYLLFAAFPVGAQQRYESPYQRRIFSGPISERYRGQEVIQSKDIDWAPLCRSSSSEKKMSHKGRKGYKNGEGLPRSLSG